MSVYALMVTFYYYPSSETTIAGLFSSLELAQRAAANLHGFVDTGTGMVFECVSDGGSCLDGIASIEEFNLNVFGMYKPSINIETGEVLD